MFMLLSLGSGGAEGAGDGPARFFSSARVIQLEHNSPRFLGR